MKLFSRGEVKDKIRSNLELTQEKERNAAETFKSRLVAFNDSVVDFDLKIESKRKELLDITTEYKKFVSSRDADIKHLEERRLASLEPIVSELNELKEYKKAIEESEKSLHEKQLTLEKTFTEAQKKYNDAIFEQAKLEDLQTKTIEVIQMAEKNAQAIIERSKSEEISSKDRELKVRQRESVVDLKEESNLKTETTIRALMLAADKRIEVEKIEQKKTDEKRLLLGAAIREFKKRGLWNTKTDSPIKV